MSISSTHAYSSVKQKRRSLLLSIVAISLLPLSLSGCSEQTDGRVPVAGTVNLGGNPVEAGTIEFHPKDSSGAHSGAMISQGKFEIAAIQGPRPGKYEVRVYVGDPKQIVEPEPGLPGDSSRRPAPKQIVPDKYNTKSTLEADIGDKGAKDLKFDLETK